MRHAAKVVHQLGRGPILEMDGVTVSLSRNTETDQLLVHVTTDDNNEVAGADDEPLIEVSLNDATLYDYEPGMAQPHVIPATWNLDAEAYEV